MFLVGDLHQNLVVPIIGIMKLSNACPDVASTSWSILGSGKLSLGQALFKSVKSTQVLYLPFGFLTRTGFASQEG